MMMNKMLIVGTGSIGRRHTENFGKHKIDIDIVDIRDDRIAEARSKLKINNSFIWICIWISSSKISNISTT